MTEFVGPESLLVAIALLIALVYPQLGDRWFCAIERRLGAIARRPRVSVIVCGGAALLVRAALLPWLPIPAPFIHDEFSFLLASDTFAHARLTNPTHPMWMHFETFHVIFHPTYASMYQPLTGIVLAFGQVVLGHPFWGVWLSVGLMCAAFCWMLQAWLPPSWALLGGMLPVLRFGVFSYWDNGYWGGALAATAGALVMGAIPRIMRRQRVVDAIVMAVGIAMLTNTRPYEGFWLSAASAGILIYWITSAKPTPNVGFLLRRVALPMLLVLIVAGAATSYYCWRVTGYPLRLPQQVNRETYAIAKYFYWQKPYPEPIYHYPAMREFYRGVELAHFQRQLSIRGFSLGVFIKVGLWWSFYIGSALTIPLLFSHLVSDRRIRLLVLCAAACLLGNGLVAFYGAHYSAPIAGAIVAIVLQGMRHLRQWSLDGKRTGLFLVRALVLVFIIMVGIEVPMLSSAQGSWESPDKIRPDFPEQRKDILAVLNRLPERQLVLVRYRSEHDPLVEWVYNAADIDRSKIVWAHDMGNEQNSELLEYYRDRCVWLLDADATPPRLSRYPTASAHLTIAANESPSAGERSCR